MRKRFTVILMLISILIVFIVVTLISLQFQNNNKSFEYKQIDNIENYKGIDIYKCQNLEI